MLSGERKSRVSAVPRSIIARGVWAIFCAPRMAARRSSPTSSGAG